MLEWQLPKETKDYLHKAIPRLAPAQLQGVLKIANAFLKRDLKPPHFEFQLEELDKATIDVLSSFCRKCEQENRKRDKKQEILDEKR